MLTTLLPTKSHIETAPDDSGLRLKGAARTLSLSEQIAETICEAILKGDYKPGAPIGEQMVSDQFGVSRGPVRDALRILEAEGLVEILPRRGARVTKLSVAEVDQLYEIRAVLLGLAAQLVARERPQQVLDELVTLLQQLEKNFNKKNDFEVHFNISSRLNWLIASGCGNAKLSSMLFTVARQVARYQRLGISTPERRAESLKGWKDLVVAIVNGDEESAEKIQRRQVNNSHLKILEIIKSESE